MTDGYTSELTQAQQTYLQDDDDQHVGAAPAWIMSIAVHALLLGVMSLIVFGSLQQEEEPPIQLANTVVAAPDKDEPKPERSLDEVKITIPEDVKVDQAVTVDLDVPVEDLSTEDPIEEATVEPKGSEAHANMEMNAAVAFAAIGPGGSSASPFGNRRGANKKRAGLETGVSRESELAVNAALLWFKRHQSPNGQWDVDGYMDNCEVQPKCEPGTEHTKENGDGDNACSAYALLCFLGSGYDHKTPGKFKDTVARGVAWLVAQQNKDGTFGVQGRNYENGICAMALCEAYAMTNDPDLKQPAQKAIDRLVKRQAKSDTYNYGLGWDYTKANIARNDASVTGWCVMAIKTAKSAGLDVGDAWEGSKQWLDESWKAGNPDHANMDSYAESNFPYMWNAKTGAVEKSDKAHTPIGALCAVFLGHQPGDIILDTMINSIMHTQLPKAYPTNTYYLYYDTLAVFQYGGEQWKKWNAETRDVLVDSQHGTDSGCFNGSWDFEGTEFHGFGTGRLLSTAYCCLSLEVYYRYARVNELR